MKPDVRSSSSLALPNILLITSDQHRADALGVAGHPCVRTPHLDTLAFQGVQFRRAYTDCPICIPSRTTLVTGVQAHHNGMPAYAADYRVVRPREAFLGSLITRAGYQTQLVGKTHWHTDTSFRGGFEAVTFLAQHRMTVAAHQRQVGDAHGIGVNEMSPTQPTIPTELQSSRWITDRCLDFLALRDRTVPFFLWASYQDPHPPNAIHEPYYSMYRRDGLPSPVRPAWCRDESGPSTLFYRRMASNPGPMGDDELAEARAVYFGMVTHLDHQIGRLFGRLMADGLWQNTLVIYTSDHGEMLGDFGAFGKTTFLESSCRVPLLVRPPADWRVTPGRTSDALVQIADVLPTVCEAAGVAAPDDVDGRSLLGIVREEADRVHGQLHGQIEDAHVLTDGRWKYLYFADDGSELLFDLAEDPGETTPLAADRAEAGAWRTALLDHLRSEKHPHAADGRLLNRKAPRRTPAEARAASAAGLAGISWGAGWARDIQHFH